MDEKLMEQFKEQFKTELEKAFSRGVWAGGAEIAKNILKKINEYKHNHVIAVEKVKSFCNYVVQYVKLQETNVDQKTNTEDKHEKDSNDI